MKDPCVWCRKREIPTNRLQTCSAACFKKLRAAGDELEREEARLSRDVTEEDIRMFFDSEY